jgi:hypothetical protein
MPEFYLSFYVAINLAFYLTFSLTYILDTLSEIYSGILSDLSGILSDMLFILTYLLAISHEGLIHLKWAVVIWDWQDSLVTGFFRHKFKWSRSHRRAQNLELLSRWFFSFSRWLIQHIGNLVGIPNPGLIFAFISPLFNHSLPPQDLNFTIFRFLFAVHDSDPDAGTRRRPKPSARTRRSMRWRRTRHGMCGAQGTCWRSRWEMRGKGGAPVCCWFPGI